ncbi:hypothetical protein DSL72_002188 [Monilinia vaccinii-corymbosi]|uniref:BTB domain-containing protein n=1 Tax=Monilinia vaccinii-corymbosi TaxID=61207 RepID=A0A8A3PBZ0_9HELO|nr:hypothetical protein DSL72_002188 [Monilinia vaccinii-corymbosi]
MSPARSSGSVETTRATWAKMMNASEYSDFIIKCHTKTFHVHRVVVCTQSKPIQAAANGNFRTWIQESITGILDLEDDDPCTVARMIHFLYLQDYDDGEEEAEAPARGRLLVNAMVYVLADKYDVPALQARARDKYEEALATAWDPLSFVASLELAYEQLPETDTRLTALALRAAGQHVRELGGCEEFAGGAAFSCGNGNGNGNEDPIAGAIPDADADAHEKW